MARTPKADQPRKVNLASPEDYAEFMKGVDGTKGKLDTARMANASEWKKADDKNIHAQCAKLMLKLRKMDDLKRNDWLRSFDLYREYEDFDESDLIDAAEEAAISEAQAIENAEIHQEEVDQRKAETEDKVVETAEKAEIEDSFDVDTETEEDAESVMKKGYEACTMGFHKVNDNPYDSEEDTILFDAWVEGWEACFNEGKYATAEAA